MKMSAGLVLVLCLAVLQPINGFALMPDALTLGDLSSLLMRHGNLIEVLQNLTDTSPLAIAEAMADAGCDAKAVDAVRSQGWKACVNLTQSFTYVQEWGYEVYQSGLEARQGGADLYGNLTVCSNLTTLIATLLCSAEGLQTSGPVFSTLLTSAIGHMRRYEELYYDLVKYYTGCFNKGFYTVDGVQYDLKSLIDKFCPKGTDVEKVKFLSEQKQRRF